MSSPPLDRRALTAVAKRTVREFRRDNLTSWAAALTYYGVLSIFPGLLVLVAVLGLLDDSLTESLRRHLGQILPDAAREVVFTAIADVQQGQARPGLAAIVGLVVMLWTASGYVAAFMKAANAIYDVPEGRPVWKLLPIRLLVTIVTGLLMVVGTAVVVFSGRVARQAGTALGVGPETVRVWDIVKWPLLVVLVVLLLAVLYWAAPNARLGGPRAVWPGGALAVLAWIAVSVLFAVYAANFASYNKTYGTLAGVIIFLVWLWLTNLAVLFGAELNAELARQRAIAAGHPEEKEPYVRLRAEPRSGGERF